MQRLVQGLLLLGGGGTEGSGTTGLPLPVHLVLHILNLLLHLLELQLLLQLLLLLLLLLRLLRLLLLVLMMLMLMLILMLLMRLCCFLFLSGLKIKWLLLRTRPCLPVVCQCRLNLSFKAANGGSITPTSDLRLPTPPTCVDAVEA
jgi:hypothetical protein